MPALPGHRDLLARLAAFGIIRRNSSLAIIDPEAHFARAGTIVENMVERFCR